MTTKEIFFFALGAALMWFWLSERRSQRMQVLVQQGAGPAQASPRRSCA